MDENSNTRQSMQSAPEWLDQQSVTHAGRLGDTSNTAQVLLLLIYFVFRVINS